MTICSLALALVPAAYTAPQAPQAVNSLHWTYAEAGVTFADPDGFDTEVGLFGRGSLLLPRQDMLFLFGGIGFETLGVSVPFATFDNGLELGAGLRFPLGERTDLWGGLALAMADSDWGWGLRGGLRHKLEGPFELEGTLYYHDIDDFEDETSLSLGGRYWTTETMGLGGELIFSDDVWGILLGVRFAL
jgi:hypothetical protein